VILKEDCFEQIKLTSPKETLEEAGAQDDIYLPKRKHCALKKR
jgi:putative intracellular protease/amidase